MDAHEATTFVVATKTKTTTLFKYYRIFDCCRIITLRPWTGEILAFKSTTGTEIKVSNTWG